MSKFIINEYPLVVLPCLATTIGLNEAIILQQIHYWLDPKLNPNVIEDKYWVYNTYDQWLEQFPFWSITTIKRAIISLEKKGIVISSSFNKDKFNKTKWYSINYDVLGEFVDKTDRLGQNDPSVAPKGSNSRINMIRSYKETEITTKITTKNSLSNKSDHNSQEPKIHSLNLVEKYEREKEMINIWNEVIEEGKDTTTHLTEKRAFLLGLRLKEYFEEDILLWKEFCRRITTSKFLMGEVTNFRAQLDWVLNEENLIKILENSYGIGDRSVQSINKIEKETDLEEEIEIKDPVWLKTRQRLEKQLGKGVFRSWIGKLKYKYILGNNAHFVAPTQFIKDWIMNNYMEDIINAFNESITRVKEVSIVISNKEEGLV